MITRHVVAEKIVAWLHHDLTLAELVDWAEEALEAGDFAEDDTAALAEIVARLGYTAHVNVTAA